VTVGVAGGGDDDAWRRHVVEWQGRRWVAALPTGVTAAMVLVGAAHSTTAVDCPTPKQIPTRRIGTVDFLALRDWAAHGTVREIAGRIIDRALLRESLLLVPPCQRVTLRADEDPEGMLRLDGDPWVVLVMPMRITATDYHTLDGDLEYRDEVDP